jgi:hypothetical protein
MSDNEAAHRTFCPSAQPDWPGAVAFGIVGGTATDPRVGYLETTQPVSEQLLKLAEPVTAPEVFRFAASCLHGACLHFQDNTCTLVQRVVKLLPEVTLELPDCAIRESCRWWRQEGAVACRRCPQVVTDNYNPSGAMRAASAPRELMPAA